jgi:hypothetical protein
MSLSKTNKVKFGNLISRLRLNILLRNNLVNLLSQRSLEKQASVASMMAVSGMGVVPTKLLTNREEALGSISFALMPP